MLTQLLTETILGALTGYLTNDTAIRSLFQKNGVIEKTRDAFAREAGALLEEQVLTREVLAAQLRRPEVQACLAEALEDFFTRQLPAALTGAREAGADDLEKTAETLADLLCAFLSQERDSILAFLRRALPQEDWPCQRVAEQLAAVLTETLEEENFAPRFCRAWLADRGAQSLEALGLGPWCRALVEEAARRSADWQRSLLRENRAQLRRLLKESMEKLRLRAVLLELDAQMEQTEIGQCLRCDAAQGAALLRRLLHSEAGQRLLRDISRALLSAVQAIETPLDALLPREFLDSLGDAVEAVLPHFLLPLRGWLQENAPALRQMFQETLEEIAAEVGGVRGMVLEELQEDLLRQFAEPEAMEQLARQVLADEAGDTGDALRRKMESLLSQHSPGSLIRRFEAAERRRSARQPEPLETILARLLTEKLDELLLDSGSDLLERLLHRKIGALHLAEQQEKVEDALCDVLLRGLEQLDLPRLLRRQGDRLCRLRADDLPSVSDAGLEAALRRLVAEGCRGLETALSTCPAGKIYGTLYDALETVAADAGARWIGSLLRSLPPDRLLREIWDLLRPRREQILEALSEAAVTHLSGVLSRLAEREIRALDRDALLRLVEELMGRELKPLNYLGAGMGALAGATLGTALAVGVPAAGSPGMLAAVLAGKTAVFGAVGYGTNCAAVKGLFWPYEPLCGIEMLQGVIPKQKARFAHGMGRLVEQYVIHPGVLQEALAQLDARAESIAARLAADAAVWRTAASELAAARKGISRALLRLCSSREIGWDRLPEQLGEVPLSALLRGARRPEIAALLPELERLADRALHSSTPLGQVLPAARVGAHFRAFLSARELPDLAEAAERVLHREESLTGILGAERARTLQEKLEAGAAAALIHPERRARIAGRAASFLAAKAPSLVPRREAVSGLFQLLIEEVPRALLEKQGAITEALQSRILSRLRPVQVLGYGMLDGDDLTARVVDRLLRDKLPRFLSDRREALEDLFWQCWRHGGPAFAGTLLRRAPLEALLDRLLAEPGLHCALGGIVRRASACFADAPVIAWGRWLNPEPLLRRPQTALGLEWHLHRAEVADLWQPFFSEFYRREISPVPLRRWFAACRETPPVSEILLSPRARDQLEAFSERLWQNLAATKLRQWVPRPEFAALLRRGGRRLSADADFLRWADYSLQLILLRLAEDWRAILPEHGRRLLAEAALRAAHATGSRYGVPLLEAMDLANLAERQLLCMDSRHLEDVVWGFAGHYLRHIERRGWWGAAFALPGMLLYLF